jgi:hypothetical protein
MCNVMIIHKWFVFCYILVMGMRFSLILFIGLFLVSCQKKGSDIDAIPLPEGYFIRCKIDGIDKSFNIMAKATKLVKTDQVFLSIFGKASTEMDNIERLNMGISSISQIKTGHYAENDPSLTYFIDAIYNPDNSLETWTIGSPTENSIPFTIFITGIDNKSVSGTFKGSVFNKYSRGINTKTITNGEFYVPFNTPPL